MFFLFSYEISVPIIFQYNFAVNGKKILTIIEKLLFLEDISLGATEKSLIFNFVYCYYFLEILRFITSLIRNNMLYFEGKRNIVSVMPYIYIFIFLYLFAFSHTFRLLSYSLFYVYASL